MIKDLAFSQLSPEEKARIGAYTMLKLTLVIWFILIALVTFIFYLFYGQ